MAVNYTKTAWQDGSDGGTAITAARLNNIEDGLEAVVSQSNDNAAYVNSLFATKEYTLAVGDYKTSAGMVNVKYDLRLDGYTPVGFFWGTNHAYSVSLGQTNVKADDYSWIVLNIGTYYDDLTVTLRVVYAKKSA